MGGRTMSDDLRTVKEYWDEAKRDLGYIAYFVSRDEIYGDPRSWGPFSSAQEALDRFQHIYPAFDGAGVWVTKVESRIPGVSASELRRNAFQEEYEINVDPETQHWGELYRKSTTLCAR